MIIFPLWQGLGNPQHISFKTFVRLWNIVKCTGWEYHPWQIFKYDLSFSTSNLISPTFQANSTWAIPHISTLFVAAKNVKTRCTKIWLLRQAIGHLELLGICLKHIKNLSQYPKSQVVVESSISNQCCKQCVPYPFKMPSGCHPQRSRPVTTETTSTQLGHGTSINALNSSIRRTSSCFRLHLGGVPICTDAGKQDPSTLPEEIPVNFRMLPALRLDQIWSCYSTHGPYMMIWWSMAWTHAVNILVAKLFVIAEQTTMHFKTLQLHP